MSLSPAISEEYLMTTASVYLSEGIQKRLIEGGKSNYNLIWKHLAERLKLNCSENIKSADYFKDPA